MEQTIYRNSHLSSGLQCLHLYVVNLVQITQEMWLYIATFKTCLILRHLASSESNVFVSTYLIWNWSFMTIFKTSVFCFVVSFVRDQKCSFNQGAAMQSSQCKLRQFLAMVKLSNVWKPSTWQCSNHCSYTMDTGVISRKN